MTPSELKALHEQHNPSSSFFSRDSMRFHGDTMQNYGVCAAMLHSDDGRAPVQAWELFRRRPVKFGQHSSAFFDAMTFKRIHLGGS